MSVFSLTSFLSDMRAAAVTVLDVTAAFIGWLPGAGLLRLALLSLALAFFMSLLPAALLLFVLFVLIKAVAGGSADTPIALSYSPSPQPK